MLILDVHELTIDAIVKKDRSLLLRALAMDPLVNSIATAQQLLSEIYAAEAEILPLWMAAPETPLRGISEFSSPGPAPQLF
jgi:alpha-galactosidase